MRSRATGQVVRESHAESIMHVPRTGLAQESPGSGKGRSLGVGSVACSPRWKVPRRSLFWVADGS